MDLLQLPIERLRLTTSLGASESHKTRSRPVYIGIGLRMKFPLAYLALRKSIYDGSLDVSLRTVRTEVTDKNPSATLLGVQRTKISSTEYETAVQAAQTRGIFVDSFH